MTLAVRFPETTPSGELRASLGGVEVTGTSVSALATAFAVDRYATAVDMGRCSAALAAQDTVLLTHCHSDHVAGLVAWLSAHTRRHRERPTRVVVPAARRQPLLEALAVWPDLEGVRRRVDLDRALTAALPGDTVDLGDGGRARAFAVHHSTPSLGWTILEAGRPRPVVVFTGDGTVEPFHADPSLLDAEAAVVDCSFIEPGTRVAARLGGHGHLQDWVELLGVLPCDTLVLAHLQPEVTAQDVLARLDEASATDGPVIVPWVTAGDTGPDAGVGAGHRRT